MAIIALLVAILLPALSKAQEEARSVVCRSNLSHWTLALLLYVQNSNDQMLYNTPCWPPGQALENGWPSKGIPPHPYIREGFAWIQNPAFRDMLLDIHRGHGAESNPNRNILCPTFKRFYDSHPGGSWALTGYHFNGNLSQVGGELWTNWVDKTPTMLSAISRQARTPWLIDAAGWWANYYGGYPGCPSAYDPGAKPPPGYSYNLFRWLDVKYRHNDSANLGMIDRHVENVHGIYNGDETEHTDSDDTAYHTELNLLENGKPYEWHWKYNPYNP